MRSQVEVLHSSPRPQTATILYWTTDRGPSAALGSDQLGFTAPLAPQHIHTHILTRRLKRSIAPQATQLL